METARLLACLRRASRPANVPPLPKIRSLAYFQPVIEELLDSQALKGYLEYLRVKLRSLADNAMPANVQKNTFPDDRQQTDPPPVLVIASKLAPRLATETDMRRVPDILDAGDRNQTHARPQFGGLEVFQRVAAR